MEIETLKAMTEDMYLNQLMMIEVTMLITIFFAIAGFAIYLAGIAWLCFKEMRQPARLSRKKTAMVDTPADSSKKRLARTGFARQGGMEELVN